MRFSAICSLTPAEFMPAARRPPNILVVAHCSASGRLFRQHRCPLFPLIRLTGCPACLNGECRLWEATMTA